MTSTTEHPGVIVVGVDNTDGAHHALDFALREGLVRGATVEVVTAWTWDSPLEGITNASTVDAARDTASAMQAGIVQQALDRLEEHPVVSQVVVHEYAGHALVARSENALMLVVGSERKGAMSRLVLGSVSEHCVRHAVCPVVVVPDPARVDHQAPAAVEETAGAPA